MTGGVARSGASARHRKLGRDERRASIVSAAASVFASDGYAATSMADVSRAAGVSHLIVYRHFDSKAELYEAVLGRAHDHLRAALAGAGASGRFGPTPAALLDAARRDEDAFRVLWRHAARERQFCHHADDARERLLDATADALEPIVPPAHLRWAARATVAYVLEAVLVWIEDGDERLDDRFTAATAAALKAGVRTWSTLATLERPKRRADGA